MSASSIAFTEDDAAAVHRVIHARRDMRHFSGGQVAPQVLRRLLAAAHAAPSVGLSQPWRFVRIADPRLRQALHAAVQTEVTRTAEALGARRDEFLRLKVEGLRDCAELLVVAVDDGGTREIFGRRTLPEMSLASAACAIQNLWLAARAENLGMGWVSMFDPSEVAALLAMPDAVKPIALLCLGPVPAFYAAPLLELENWRHARPIEDLLSVDRWPAEATR